VMVAAHMVQVEGYDVIIGGGLESITMLQNDFNKTNLFNTYFKDHHSAIYMPMGQTAEIVAERYKVSREAQDRYALLSQQRTAAAQREGKFKDEIAPMKATMEVTDKATGQKSKKEVVVDRDECNRPDTTLEDIDVVELNEAFASQVVYCRDRLGIDPERLNPNGGSISIGHPYGMTGSRMTGTLLHELRRRKKRWGIVTMCIGGGMGAAGLFEAAS